MFISVYTSIHFRCRALFSQDTCITSNSLYIFSINILNFKYVNLQANADMFCSQLQSARFNVKLKCTLKVHNDDKPKDPERFIIIIIKFGNQLEQILCYGNMPPSV